MVEHCSERVLAKNEMVFIVSTMAVLVTESQQTRITTTIIIIGTMSVRTLTYNIIYCGL